MSEPVLGQPRRDAPATAPAPAGQPAAETPPDPPSGPPAGKKRRRGSRGRGRRSGAKTGAVLAGPGPDAAGPGPDTGTGAGDPGDPGAGGGAVGEAALARSQGPRGAGGGTASAGPSRAPVAAGDGSAGGPGRSAGDGSAGPGRSAEEGTAGGPGPAPDLDDPDYDARPDDLPDRPIEGRASPGAAAAASVPRPRIGDTRPAPQIGDTRPAPGGLDGGGARRGRGGAATAAAAGEGAGAGGATGTKKKRRRGGRGATVGGGEQARELAPAELVAPGEETLERLRGRERNGRPVGRYQMAVQVRHNATQIAVLEGRALIEHYVSRPQDDVAQIDGNIYLGRVQNVLPGMEAAFVDISTPKNAVLYRGDVRYDPDDLVAPGRGAVEGPPPRPKGEARIEQLLRQGQTIVCQVTKNPIGTKGARLTQEVSLPGRFVVLIPNSDTYGISKRLGDEERRRLRRVLDEVKPERHGIIVRTAAEGATTDELRRDVIRLVQQWEAIEGLARRSSSPRLLYREPGMAVRVIREEFNRDYRSVVIDDPQLYTEVREYVASISPHLEDRVELFDTGDPLPLFERLHVHEQLHKALDRKVWLPSGGSLIIERTEALTVIDVNTGKNVGRSSLEETVFRNNLEAAEEIARQLRLRDVGGIIVIDFIDMEVRQNRDEVVRVFRDALARDKTRTQVFPISELGLVEMTRKRVSEGLVESFSLTCPACAGRGIVFDDSLL